MVAMLGLGTQAAFAQGAALRSHPEPEVYDGTDVLPADTPEAFRQYFARQFDAGSCAVFFADLTGDGEAEMIVTDYGYYWDLCTSADGQTMEQINFFSSTLVSCSDGVYSAQEPLISVTVLQQQNGSVIVLGSYAEYTCGENGLGQPVYATVIRDDEIYLLNYTTAADTLIARYYRYPNGKETVEEYTCEVLMPEYLYVGDIYSLLEVEGQMTVADLDTFDLMLYDLDTAEGAYAADENE